MKTLLSLLWCLFVVNASAQIGVGGRSAGFPATTNSALNSTTGNGVFGGVGLTNGSGTFPGFIYGPTTGLRLGKDNGALLHIDASDFRPQAAGYNAGRSNIRFGTGYYYTLNATNIFLLNSTNVPTSAQCGVDGIVFRNSNGTFWVTTSNLAGFSHKQIAP